MGPQGIETDRAAIRVVEWWKSALLPRLSRRHKGRRVLDRCIGAGQMCDAGLPVHGISCRRSRLRQTAARRIGSAGAIVSSAAFADAYISGITVDPNSRSTPNIVQGANAAVRTERTSIPWRPKSSDDLCGMGAFFCRGAQHSLGRDVIWFDRPTRLRRGPDL